MANIHVDYASLTTSANQLKSGKEEVNAKLVQLKAMIDNLVSSGFVTDQASGKFQQSYEQWNSGAKNVIEGLDGMSAFLNQAISSHQELDSSLSSGA